MPEPKTKLRLSLCSECGTFDAPTLRSALKETDLPDGVSIDQSPCLGPCKRPSVMAIQTPEHTGYVFAGVTIKDANDIAATCALILKSDQGWIEDARPCGRLRHLLVARMPG